ncbi:MAG: HAMP domain-containing sensor histidine kinase [Vicinamibacterales bacterium]
MSAPRRSRSTIIVAMLIATLAMTAMLAWEAQQAARSHRATAENVLRDYAKFAAWELSRLGRQQLLNAMNTELGEVQASLKSGGLEAALGTSAPCAAGCGATHTVLTAFSASLPNAEFRFAGAPVDDGVRALLAGAVAEGLRKPQEFTCPTMRVTRINGTPAVVVWRPVHDRNDRLSGVVGFVADLPFVTRPFENVARHTSLLPPSLVPAGGHANEALAVRVSSAGGERLYASADAWSRYEAEDQLTREFDRLRLAVALRPETAEGLIIGGLPRERLPLIVGLLTLTAGLVVVALVQLRREAELARMRSDFVSGVSHELRTPLAQIRMFTETLLLGRVRTAGEGRRSLEIIARETQRLIHLVENVLLFSRGERSIPHITRAPERLAPIVADVVEGFAPLAAARQVRLTTALDETANAPVDAGAIRQILLNLLDNAVKYGPAGQEVTIQLRLQRRTALLAVEDQGPGIAETDTERIWQPFNRLARADDATGGAGIGLSIVRQLADLHGGRAWVERAPSGGARFVVELPDAWASVGADTAAVA